MDWIVFPSKSCVEVLIHRMTVFGNRTFTEVIKVKWGHKDSAITWYGCCSYKKRKRPRGVYTEKRTCEVTPRGWHLWPKERGLRRNQTCENFDLRFLAPRTVRNTYLLFSHRASILLWQPYQTNTICKLKTGQCPSAVE